jgi:phosphoglucomutase
MDVSPGAGKPAEPSMLVNVPKLVTAYYTEMPEPAVREQRVSFGTSGHRGSSLTMTFNERHILAITQSICLYRKGKKIDGPLFLGMDTHALSVPAFSSAIEVLAANGVDIMIAEKEEYTPNPVISHAILTEFGEPLYDRIEAAATPEQKEILKKLSPGQVASTALAGE